MLIDDPVTIDLSLIDFYSFNFSEVDLSQTGLSEIDLTQAGFSEVDLTKVNLANVDLTQINLNKVDFSKVDPHLICLMIFFPYLKQKMKEEKDVIERKNKKGKQNKIEKESFHLESGYDDYHWIHPETKQRYKYRICFNGDILVRRQEQKASEKPKDGYRIEVLGKAEDKGGGFSLIYPVLKTICLNSDFTLNEKKPYSVSSKKRIVKKQKLFKDSFSEKWNIKQEIGADTDPILKNTVSLTGVEREAALLKAYSKIGAKTPIKFTTPVNKDEFVFQVMKEVPGERLDYFLGLDLNKELFPSFQARLRIFAALIQEVKNLHCNQKIIHCDLKPENIYINYNENSSAAEITLLDLGGGFSKDQGAKLGCSRHITHFYYAPEQRSWGFPTEQVDIHALGQMIKKDFFPLDLHLESRFSELSEDQKKDFSSYREKIEKQTLSECEIKQKEALQDLAKCMTYAFPEARSSLDQVIKTLDHIQYQIPRQSSQTNALSPDENEEKAKDLKVEDLIVTQHIGDSQESASFEKSSNDSAVGLTNRSFTSPEHRSGISDLSEKRAENSSLDESKTITNHSIVFVPASQSLPQKEATEKENPAIIKKALKQIMLLESLEKELANKKLAFCYNENETLEALVKNIKGHCYYKDEPVRAKKSELIQTVPLNVALNNVLIRILEEVSASQEEVDAFDLSICQALIRYIAQTATPENIQKRDRAASTRRINDINCLLDQLHGKSTQDKAPKTKLELDVIVKDWSKGVTNRLGFFGKSALRSGVLAAVGLESNITQVAQHKSAAPIGLRLFLR